MKLRYLSYMLQNKNPAYGRDFSEIQIAPLKSIAKADSCNTFRLQMENHCGTHVDCPAHFFQDGKSVTDYHLEEWIFQSPFVLNLPLREDSMVFPEDVKRVPEGSDLILIQSGFSGLRGTKKYSFSNPGVAVSTGLWLRKNRPLARALGLDFISISPYQNREEGRKAHRVFLEPLADSQPILLIEDMDLSSDLSGLSSVWVVPLRMQGLDSAPCSVIGVFS